MFCFSAWRSATAQTAFAPLLRRLDAAPVMVTTGESTHKVSAPLVVMVREVGESDKQIGYRVKTGLNWRVPFARDSSDVKLILLVDRIALDVRSYRPRGDDYRVILHCRLVDLTRRQVVSDFVVRGDTPADRSGLFAGLGWFDRFGSEPWNQVGAHVEASLGQS
jgi:hypothetical protein